MHEDDYKTTDLALASALVAAGHELVDLRREGIGKFSFTFRNKLFLMTHVNAYWNDTLELPARKLLETQKTLKARIYSSN